MYDYDRRMHEIAPGLYDWTTFHEGIGQPVHSHFHVPSGTLIDPRVPEGGVEAVTALGRVESIVLTNRHHARHSEQFGEPLAVSPGDEVAPGVRIVEVGAITPEEVGVVIDGEDGFLALGDIVIRGEGGALMFVPDFLLGEDPEADKRAMTSALSRLLEEERFDGLLLAHGAPFATGARDALAAFVASR